ncbi:hypothetical protein PILCRDRAFT_502833 [Piloderma croceum F 1598]|uniref:Uncharacterized protein n=1 Tax=Piloderma croceum (strain F 1598) TaxID=765440 RepID=A0A0C3FN69_PILCF|nr:hypothetical protein PILCRDRAFT_502833 [Piloderma croceum F 1598]
MKRVSNRLTAESVKSSANSGVGAAPARRRTPPSNTDDNVSVALRLTLLTTQETLKHSSHLPADHFNVVCPLKPGTSVI